MKLSIVGGPLDGARAQTSTKPKWGWVDADGRVWRAPRPGRILHKLVAERSLDPLTEKLGCVYLYAAQHGFCQSCGCYHEVPEGKTRAETPCSVCGGALATG